VNSLDLGLIGNESLKYLAKNLENLHHLDSIWFGESMLFCYYIKARPISGNRTESRPSRQWSAKVNIVRESLPLTYTLPNL
jgi:hypothetical protein